MENVLVFSDGNEISSGASANPAIKSLSYSYSAVTDTDFFYGSAAAAIIEFSLLDNAGTFSIIPGDPISCYKIDSNGERRKLGEFVATTIKKQSPHSMTIYATDRMTLLDVDVSEMIANLDGWPYTINQLLFITAEYCGVTVASNIDLINGEHTVPRFVTQTTGRKMIQWIAQANACFARMDADGFLGFSALQEKGDLSAAIKKITVSDYLTTPIARVVVKQSENDVGVFWPAVEGESYEIVKNPLLATFSEEDMLPVVKKIAEKVVGLMYTPATVTVWDETDSIGAGNIFSFKQGEKIYTTIAFSEKRTGSVVTLKSTGNSSRTASTALYGKDPVEVVQGRMTEIIADLEGVATEVTQTTIALDSVKKETSQLKQTTKGLDLQVQETKKTTNETVTRLTALETDADSLELSIVSVRTQLGDKADKDSVEEISKTFHFDENGLTIANSATGMGISVSEERVAFTGGAQEPTTIITPTEMETTNLRVGRQLDLGNFSFIPRTNGNLSMRWKGG